MLRVNLGGDMPFATRRRSGVMVNPATSPPTIGKNSDAAVTSLSLIIAPRFGAGSVTSEWILFKFSASSGNTRRCCEIARTILSTVDCVMSLIPSFPISHDSLASRFSLSLPSLSKSTKNLSSSFDPFKISFCRWLLRFFSVRTGLVGLTSFGTPLLRRSFFFRGSFWDFAGRSFGVEAGKNECPLRAGAEAFSNGVFDEVFTFFLFKRGEINFCKEDFFDCCCCFTCSCIVVTCSCIVEELPVRVCIPDDTVPVRLCMLDETVPVRLCMLDETVPARMCILDEIVPWFTVDKVRLFDNVEGPPDSVDGLPEKSEGFRDRTDLSISVSPANSLPFKDSLTIFSARSRLYCCRKR
mmetsp:Transcript_25366/g.59398  ORF Transcript_25366/g.59398 Transcript_25366/m.59398 type:complete len:354 (-) Transcript_25366:1137-2198(-)